MSPIHTEYIVLSVAGLEACVEETCKYCKTSE